MSGRGYPKFRNDRAVADIRIGVREFNCIGVSPPQVYINMGEQDAICLPLLRDAIPLRSAARAVGSRPAGQPVRRS
jgi:uncharacterized Zn-finger protein